MSARLRLLSVLLLAALAFAPASARLGETLDQLKERYGRPEPEARRGNFIWLFEGDDGALLYTVTFNAEGRSIAEGLKPYKRARFTDNNALDFIETQLAQWNGSPTMRTLKPGDKYRFAGQDFVCGKLEHVVVDEPKGILLIWTKKVDPAVIIVTPEMFNRVK